MMVGIVLKVFALFGLSYIPNFGYKVFLVNNKYQIKLEEVIKLFD